MTGHILTTCPECLHTTRVLVDFPLPNAGFLPTEWVCPDCGAALTVRDEHEYNDDGTINEIGGKESE